MSGCEEDPYGSVSGVRDRVWDGPRWWNVALSETRPADGGRVISNGVITNAQYAIII